MRTDNRFDRILAEVWEEVKDLEGGVLYKTIFILDPDNAIDICDIFEIEKSSYLYNDIQTLDQVKIFQDILDAFDPWKIR